MDTSEMQELLQGYLGELDWTSGATKDDLLAHLAGRDEALRTMVNQYLAEGTYESVDAVMRLIPVQAWQNVQGDTWRGAESLAPDDVPSQFQEGLVGQDERDVYREGGPPPATPGFGQSAGAVADASAGGRSATVATGQPRQDQTSAGDRGTPPTSQTIPAIGAGTAERIIPVALSALVEGLGQAYNRQPAKAAGLLVAGLGLSTASGLNTWLARRVFPAKQVTIGAERIRPVLLVAWAATYAFNLWDAWASAAGRETEAGGGLSRGL